MVELRRLLHRTSRRIQLRHLPQAGRHLQRSIHARSQQARHVRDLQVQQGAHRYAASFHLLSLISSHLRPSPCSVQQATRVRGSHASSARPDPVVRHRTGVHAARSRWMAIRLAQRRLPSSTGPVLLWCGRLPGAGSRHRRSSLQGVSVLGHQHQRHERRGHARPVGVSSRSMRGYRRC